MSWYFKSLQISSITELATNPASCLIFPSDMTEAKQIQKKCTKLGMRLLLIKQKHLGSDHLPSYIEGLVNYLEETE